MAVAEPVFLDTSVLLGGLIELADPDTPVTENRRHFTALLRHGVAVLTAAEFAAEADLGPP